MSIYKASCKEKDFNVQADQTVTIFTYIGLQVWKQELSEDSMLDYSIAYLITEIMDSNVVAC